MDFSLIIGEWVPLLFGTMARRMARCDGSKAEIKKIWILMKHGEETKGEKKWE